jgi:hypothetical protein
MTAAVLTGCTQFPELDHTQSATLEAAEYPALVPIEPLLARATATGTDPVQTENNLNSRLAGLRARANAMRGAVLSDAEKRRLETGLR